MKLTKKMSIMANKVLTQTPPVGGSNVHLINGGKLVCLDILNKLVRFLLNKASEFLKVQGICKK